MDVANTVHRRILFLLTVVALLGAGAWPFGQTRARHGSLFPPQDLGLLEGPDRDAWQRPDYIMDALRIGEGSTVADVGAGGGWFTTRLARRVGPNGVVYAQDVQRQMIDSIARRLGRENLRNVRTVLGTATDPRLPEGALDAALLVDAYHELEHPLQLLRALTKSLKPAGRLGIVDYKLDVSGPGPSPDDRVPQAAVINAAESAGFRLLTQDVSLPYHYLLIFGRADARGTQP